MRKLTALLLFVFAPALFAQEQNNAPGADDYILGSKDLIEIRVLEIPELNVERRVSDGGVVDLPLIGQFAVAGMTAPQARDRLQALLKSKYVNSATVTLAVKEFVNKAVTIVGAVQRPGALSVTGRWDLMQAISAVGGLTPNAGRKIYVMRHAQNGLSDTIEVKTDELYRNASGRANLVLFPSDIINVPARTTVKLFCLGEVKTPGSVEFDSDDRITLLSVIAKAGGLTDRASNSMRIKRKNEATRRDEEVLVNYARIVAGKEIDPPLRPDDVVIVPSSFF